MEEFFKELWAGITDLAEGLTSFVGLDHWIRRVAKKHSLSDLGVDVDKIVKEARNLYYKGSNLVDMIADIKSRYETGGFNLSGEAAVALGKKRRKFSNNLAKANNLSNMVNSNINQINLYADELNDPNRKISDRNTGQETDRKIYDKIKELNKENENYVSQIEKISKETH